MKCGKLEEKQKFNPCRPGFLKSGPRGPLPGRVYSNPNQTRLEQASQGLQSY